MAVTDNPSEPLFSLCQRRRFFFESEKREKYDEGEAPNPQPETYGLHARVDTTAKTSSVENTGLSTMTPDLKMCCQKYNAIHRGLDCYEWTAVS